MQAQVSTLEYYYNNIITNSAKDIYLALSKTDCQCVSVFCDVALKNQESLSWEGSGALA